MLPSLNPGVFFWSPDYGEIGESNIPEDEVLEEVHCPVCGGNLEKHFYPKDGGVKSMLRCHEKNEADCDDVAFSRPTTDIGALTMES
jgi:hypothetical protein